MRSTQLQISLLLLAALLALHPPAVPADDKAALQALRGALNGGRWNLTGADHCKWQGVRCGPSGRVIELHLPGMALVGPIPSGVLGNLTSLQFLSLRFNALTGTVPADIAGCRQLQYLYLQGNRLSGDIPAVVFSLPGLFRLNLAGNQLSGEIPPSFNNLTNLSTLFLENNRLTGQIPDLKLPNLKQLNLSHNLLTGPIPGDLCSSFRDPSSFEGNSLTPCPKQGDNHKKKSKLSPGALAGIIVGCVVALLAILLLVFLCCCRRRGDKNAGAVAAGGAATRSVDVEAPPAAAAAATTAAAAAARGKGGSANDKKQLVVFGNKGGKVMDLDELLRASAEVLGKGSYGTTYKASLDGGTAVAVKRLKDVAVDEAEFRDRMEEVGALEHGNLVALRAYHCSANEKLLVFDYLPMGSLSALLHGNRGSGRTPLNWETRSSIALGAARGVAYIHSRSPASSHGNIKSSNVLLSATFEARVSDFGLAQLAVPSAAPTNRVAGYRAPEVTDPRKVSQRADVYSFGILLLELLTGKAPAHALLNEEGVDLPRWVQSVVREEWAAEVFDMELLRYQSVEEEMVQLLQLAIDCTAQYPDSRPSMPDVASRIEEICRSHSRASHELGDITSDDPENNAAGPKST